MFALERRVKGLDGGHVRINIAGGQKHRPQAGDFLLVVHEGHHDGHLGTLRDVVETGFPEAGAASGAFGRHDELQRYTKSFKTGTKHV